MLHVRLDGTVSGEERSEAHDFRAPYAHLQWASRTSCTDSQEQSTEDERTIGGEDS